MALTQNVPAAARPADARQPGYDPSYQWDRFTHKRAVLRVQRMEQIRAMREALPRRLRVG